MTKLTTERLETIATWREKYGNGANVMIPAEEAELMARRILAYDQAAKNPVASCWSKGGILQRDQFIRYDVSSFPDGEIKLFAAPVLPKQSELVENLKKVMNNWLAMEPKLAFQPEFTDVMMLLDAEAAPAQPVSEPYKLAKPTEACTWISDGEGLWLGDCGLTWTFFDDGPNENGLKYCPSCGGKVSFIAAPAQESE